jgi:hypothetical protein
MSFCAKTAPSRAPSEQGPCHTPHDWTRPSHTPCNPLPAAATAIMSPPTAFVPLGSTSLTGAPPARSAAAVCSAPRRTAAVVAMADNKPGFSIPNPFANNPTGGVAPSGFASLQPGEPGYVAPKATTNEFMNKPIVVREEDEVYDIPSYLKPLPEDTPREGHTWKNYNGR